MKTSHAGIYEIRNVLNGHRYIGSSVNVKRRLCGHRWGLRNFNHCNKHLQSAWNKYGENNFIFRPLLYCDPDKTLLYEQIYLNNLNPEYNIAKDVTAIMLGLTHSKETRRKISEGGKGKTRPPRSAEHRRKISESHIGKSSHAWSEESKLKLSAILTGIQRSTETRKKISLSRTGTTLSVETRRKISVSLMGNQRRKGKPSSDETRRKQSEATKGKPSPKRGCHLSEEHRRKISASLVGNQYTLGYCHTEESKRKISEAQLKRWEKIRDNS